MFRRIKLLLPWRRRAAERDMREELASLLEIADRDCAGPGHLGNLTIAAENAREAWSWAWLEHLTQDLRYAARSLKASPSFTVAAALTLALAMGAGTAVFTAANAAFFRKLPVAHADELWRLSWTSRQRSFGGKFLLQPMWDANLLNQGGSMGRFSYGAYRNIRDHNRSFSDVACSRDSGPGTLVSGNYFRTLGVGASLGRVLQPADDQPGAPAIAVISYGYWRDWFGASPDIVGKVLTQDRNGRALAVPFTIVGVLAQEFSGIDPAYSGSPVYAAMQPALRNTPAQLTDNRNWNACDVVIGRLKPGASAEQARQESEALTAQTILADPPRDAYELPHLRLASFSRGLDTLRTAVTRPLLILGVAVGAFLLIACANIAGLLTARGSSRRKEVATRLALGAPRRRIIRQLLTESLVLALLGALPGFAIAILVSPQLPRLMTRRYTLPKNGATMQPDLTVALFALALTFAVALAFGLAPALNASRLDLLSMIKPPVGTQDRVRMRSGQIMLTIQVALCTALLMGAGLLLRTLFNLRAVPMGYQPKNLLFFQADLPPGRPQLVDETLERVRAVPGAVSATASMWPLFTSAPDTYVQVCGAASGTASFEDRFADSDVVLPRFFETWGVPLLRGRDFILAEAPHSIIVNQAFVARYLTGDAIGQTVRMGPDCVAETIIGVVGNSTDRARVTPRPFAYRRWTQPPPSITFAVRTAGSVTAAEPALRGILKSLNGIVREDVTTGEQYRSDTVSQERVWAVLLSGFGGVAVFVACLGIYGMLAYLVTRRTAEIGVRMALGARRPDVVRLVVRESLLPAAAGIALGLAAAYPLTKVIASMLFGVSRADPWTAAGASAALLLTAAGAALLPALRASRIDPMRALRYE